MRQVPDIRYGLLAPDRDAARFHRILKALQRGSQVIFFSVASVFVVLRLEGQGTPVYWLWFAMGLIIPHLLHIASSRTGRPEIYDRELLVAAFLQGVAVALLDFRPLPSLTVVAPISGFVLAGGLRQLAAGLVSCGTGLLLAGLILGFNVETQYGLATELWCALLLLVTQLSMALLTLRFESSLSFWRARPERSKEPP